MKNDLTVIPRMTPKRRWRAGESAASVIFIFPCYQVSGGGMFIAFDPKKSDRVGMVSKEFYLRWTRKPARGEADVVTAAIEVMEKALGSHRVLARWPKKPQGGLPFISPSEEAK